MESLRKEFYIHSQDFLKLLGEKSRRSETNKTIAEELATLDFFYDGIDVLMQKYEDQISVLKLQVINQQVIHKIIEEIHMKEFKKSLFVKKEIPNNRQMEQIKNKYKKGVKLKEITSHFYLSKSQIIDLVDG